MLRFKEALEVLTSWEGFQRADFCPICAHRDFLFSNGVRALIVRYRERGRKIGIDLKTLKEVIEDILSRGEPLEEAQRLAIICLN